MEREPIVPQPINTDNPCQNLISALELLQEQYEDVDKRVGAYNSFRNLVLGKEFWEAYPSPSDYSSMSLLLRMSVRKLVDGTTLTLPQIKAMEEVLNCIQSGNVTNNARQACSQRLVAAGIEMRITFKPQVLDELIQSWKDDGLMR